MIDVDKAVATAVKTGKVSFGTKSTLYNAKTGRAKLVILAANCPSTVRNDIEYYCQLSKVPLITYKGTSLDLAGVCGKPFPIIALSIREPGDSEILRLTEKIEEEESSGGS